MQSWILKSCYLKTRDKTLVDWRRPRKIGRNDFYWQYLFKSDILLNYFKDLKLSKKRSTSVAKEKFETDKTYRKYLVTLGRSLKNLEEKGLIRIVRDNYLGMQLTSKAQANFLVWKIGQGYVSKY